MPVPFVAETAHDDRVAAPIFRRKLAFLQLLLHAIDVRAGQIDLVDRDHDLHVRRPLSRG